MTNIIHKFANAMFTAVSLNLQDIVKMYSNSGKVIGK